MLSGSATEHVGPAYDDATRWDPDICIETALSSLPTHEHRPGEHHGRLSDIALSIKSIIPTAPATKHAPMIDYSGEYVGHGQSKTAFKLRCHDESFDGCILKITKGQYDPEPIVFRQIGERGCTKRSLYRARVSNYPYTAGLPSRRFR